MIVYFQLESIIFEVFIYNQSIILYSLILITIALLLDMQYESYYCFVILKAFIW